MIKTGGIDATFGFGKGGLWYDTEASSGSNKIGFGVRIGFRWGPMWMGYPTKWSEIWNWDRASGAVTFPFIALPFVSIVLGRFGAYLGGKYNGGADDWIIPSARIAWVNRLL